MAYLPNSNTITNITDTSGDAIIDATNNAVKVVGPIAHDSAVSTTPPVLVGGVAQNNDSSAPPNRVSAEGDVTRLATNLDGALHVLPFGPQIVKYHENSSNALTDAEVFAAPAAGLSVYIGTIVWSTGAATASTFFLEEGSTTIFGPLYLEAVAGRGVAIQFNPPLKGTVATAITVSTTGAIAHSIDITGFVAPG